MKSGVLMASVLSVVWFVVLLVFAATAMGTWMALMFPGRVDRAATAVRQAPGRCFVLGLLVWSVSITVAVILLQSASGGARVLGWVALLPAALFWAQGYAAVVDILADRMAPGADGPRRVAALVSASACTAISGLFPGVGWFLFAPAIGLLATGAGFRSAFRKRNSGKPREEISASASIAPVSDVAVFAPPVGADVGDRPCE